MSNSPPPLRFKMNIVLHDTLSRSNKLFVPQNPQRVTMYLCGPTVYNFVHIGNARPAVVFDVLVRLLRRHFQKVIFARNITDVDDKINAAANAAEVPIADIAQRYTAAYRDDMAALGVRMPDIEPLATTHIPQITCMIEALIADRHAYEAEGHVLFDVSSYPQYGQLSGRSVEDMIAGARVDVAPYKRNPADFVLWKPSSDDLPGWDSPWGRGRPGWHIECSAMSAAHLGETIDIHAGGNDLMFPHHENEIAQSTCAHRGKPFAHYWLHNGMLSLGGKKMSKSLGNVLTLHELLQQHPPEALRLLLLRAHYRQPLVWSDSALSQAVRTLDGWYGVLRDLQDVEVSAADHPIPDAIETALCDDLNTPQALAELAHLANTARQRKSPAAKIAVLRAGAALGLLQTDPTDWFRWRPAQAVQPSGIASGNVDNHDAVGDNFEHQVDQLIEQRNAARQSRDWARADAIRDQLAGIGVIIEDGPQGTRWSTSKD